MQVMQYDPYTLPSVCQLHSKTLCPPLCHGWHCLDVQGHLVHLGCYQSRPHFCYQLYHRGASNLLKLGHYCWPSMLVGSVMTTRILTQNGQVC